MFAFLLRVKFNIDLIFGLPFYAETLWTPVMKKQKNFNMRELARRLKVSPATISLALNDRPGVSPKTKAWILEEVEKLGYVPSLVGKVINRKRTGMIGMLTPVAGATLFTRMVDAVNGQSELIHLPVLVGYCQENTRVELNMLRIYMQLNLNGIIIASVAGFENQRVFQDIIQSAIPIVQVERYNAIIPGDYVGSDHPSAVYRSIEELVQKGRKRIGMVLNNIDYSVNTDLKHAYLQSLKGFGLTPDPEALLEVDFQAPDVEAKAEAYFRRKPACDAVLWCCAASLLRKTLSRKSMPKTKLPEVVLFDADLYDLPPDQRFVNYIQDGEAIGNEAYRLLSAWFGRENEFRRHHTRSEIKLPYLRTEIRGGPRIQN